MSIVLKGGRVVSGSAAGRTWERADIRIDGVTIAEVGPDLEPPRGADVIDAAGCVVMPGLINAHTHSNESFEQGAYDNLPLDLWLLQAYSPFGFPLRSPREHYLRTMLCAIRSLRAGVTTVQDDLVYPPSTADAVDEAMKAYRDAGLRAWVTVDMWNLPFMESLPFVDDLIPEPLQRELNDLPCLSTEAYVDLFERHARAWHGSEDGRLRIVAAPCGPQRCGPELLREIARLSEAWDVPIHCHTLETRLQAVHAELARGVSWIEFMDEQRLLGPRTTLVHGIWISERDMDLLASAGCSVVHNPLSNLKLGSGVCPVRTLLDRGVNMALGTDGLSTSDTPDLVEAMHVAALLHKIGDPDYEHWVSAGEVFDMATVGGARTGLMGDELGRLAPGMRADVILVDASDWGFTPLVDPVQQLVFSASSGAVLTSIVNGRVVMRDRRIETVDEDALKEEIREAAERFWREDVPKMRDGARRLRPYMEAMYRRGLEHPTPLDRERGRSDPMDVLASPARRSAG